MRKFKVVMFSILCVGLASIIGVGTFAAVYLSINVSGTVEYEATEIGARIFGTYAYNPGGNAGTANYLNLVGSGTVSDNVYYIQGKETSYSNITADVGTIEFSDKTDELELFIFIKNVGDRYIIPNVTALSTNEKDVLISSETYFFDVSEEQIDPLEEKGLHSTASSFVEKIKTEILNENCGIFSVNSSIDNQDVYVARIVIKLADSVSGDGAVEISSNFSVNIGFMADVQYISNDILSVYQEQDQSNSTWTKFGFNATLEATPTKIESNSLSNLAFYLDEADENGNTNYTLSDVYSETAPVYKDIDLVNVDVHTGEIIGKLSDLNYNFEWYGRDITLAAGTTLASGRVLTEQETFTVDVYTYYPTIYVRRWVVGNRQWISVSDKTFAGAVEIKEHYTATFEATIFNPDKTVATNDHGIITRSYVSSYVPLVYGSANYLQTNYGFGTYAGSTDSTTQSKMMEWAGNMTSQWAESSLDSQYRTVEGVQGENYTVYIYNLLYLVKYADNNSQETIGYGNTYTYLLYNAEGVTVTTESGNQITTGGNDQYTRYESEKGSGTIGVRNASSAGTATYSQVDGVYKLSADGFDEAGMNYGYNSAYTLGDDKQGLYTHQFLTYNNGTKRYVADGYVGSDRYTSVFCLGKCNPWGNVFTWVFGNAVVSDGTNMFAYINFDDYDGTNWHMQSSSAAFETKDELLTEKDYVRLTYNLPSTNGYYRYLGTSNITADKGGIESLVGLPTADASTAGTDTGLCDYYYMNISTDYIFGVLSGGNTISNTLAGAFYFDVASSITTAYYLVGFRPSLISS